MYKLVIFLLTIGVGISAEAQDTLDQVLELGKRPSISNFHAKIADGNNNTTAIPISVIKGKENGPVFTIISGVHGYEYPPIIATQELIQEINPELLSGILIIVPIANPASFFGRSPFINPQDKVNLNRAFPGNASGTITQRIANYLTENVIASTDIFVDIHGGDASEDLLPFVCYYNNEDNAEQTRKAQMLSEASGFKYVVSYPYNLKKDQVAKYGFKQAVQDGKVGLSIECGKLGNVQTENVALIKKAVYNMLNEMKMYTIEENKNVDFINLTKQVYIRSEKKGVFASTFSAGDQVNEGEVVGSIKNEFGKVLTEIKAPHSGIILYKIGTPPVNLGETLLCIAY